MPTHALASQLDGALSAVAEGVLPGLGSQSTAFTAAAVKAVGLGTPLRLKASPTPYNINAVTLPPDLALVLEPGATLARNSGATGDLITISTAADGLTIIGGTIDNDESTDDVISAASGSSNVLIKDVDFTNMGTAGAAYQVTHSASPRPVNTVIEGCTFTAPVATVNQNAITCANPDYLRVKDCKFYRTGGVNTTGTGTTEKVWVTGCEFDEVGSSNILIRPQGSGIVQDIFILNNHSRTTGTVAVAKGLVAVGEQVLGTAGSSITRRVVVAGNTIKDFEGVAINIGGGVTPGLVYDITVTGNVIDGGDLATGALKNTSSIGMQLIRNDGLTVSGNKVRMVGRSGIRMSGCINFSVTGNAVELCVQGAGYTSPPPDQESGIAMFSSTIACSNGVISGNTSKNNGTVLGNVAGIGTSATTHANITITSNRCYDDRGSPFQAYGVRLGLADADANQPVDCVIADNDCAGNVTQAIKFFNSTSKGNRVGLNGGVPDRVTEPTTSTYGWNPHTVAGGKRLKMTGVLAVNRTFNLGTSGAQEGDTLEVKVPAGIHAFVWNIGTGPLKALAAGQWARFGYYGSAWELDASGSL